MFSNLTMAATKDKPQYKPDGRAVDEGRPLRVVIIGAGISGIALYIRLLQYVPDAKVTIFEKNPSLGGTWWENRYPGVACDIPSHVYQYTFAPNPKWSKLFAPGPEILQYVKGVASQYHVDEKIKYNTRVGGATWDDKRSVWLVQTKTEGGEEQVHTAEVVISAVGVLNHWKWPDIPGLDDFKGTKLHSANWDDMWDYAGKNVALIGSGSSGIQILPYLQDKCTRVYNFIRGGAWISRSFGSTFIEDILSESDEPGNYTYTPEELERLENDEEYYLSLRRKMESSINKDFPRLFKGSPEETEATDRIKLLMRWKLFSKEGTYEDLEPGFHPGCRRLTPGPGYLEALVQENIKLIKTPIERLTENGVITTDGEEYPVDAVICATGFDCSHIPRFPIKGRNGQLLNDKWKTRASAYMSHSVPGFPNYFVVGGPNSATGSGSLLLMLEGVIGYVVKAVEKISREHIKTMEVNDVSLKLWEESLDRFFKDTVYVDKCLSWYKFNDKVIGLWPGSNVHALKVLANPRWEDYRYVQEDGYGPLDWMGNGWTVADVEHGDLGYYVDSVDIPPVPSKEQLSQQP